MARQIFVPRGLNAKIPSGWRFLIFDDHLTEVFELLSPGMTLSVTTRADWSLTAKKELICCRIWHYGHWIQPHRLVYLADHITPSVVLDKLSSASGVKDLLLLFTKFDLTARRVRSLNGVKLDVRRENLPSINRIVAQPVGVDDFYKPSEVSGSLDTTSVRPEEANSPESLDQSALLDRLFSKDKNNL